MQNWFECKLKYVKIDNDGRERKVSETYLIDAVSFTDAEARIIQEAQQFVKGEFSVVDIKQSNVIEIFDGGGEWWYKARISLVVIDEKLGRETRINNYFLISADDIESALLGLREGLNYLLVPYTTTSIALTQVCDVFPYTLENEPE